MISQPRTRHAQTRAKRILAGCTASFLAATTLIACGQEETIEAVADPQFGYAISKPILTTNAGTALGVATDAAKVSARLYPGAYIAGPDGQLLPNTDLVTATRAADDPRRVDYVINENAAFSDGVPVACEAFQLANVASYNRELFGADMPLYFQVERIDCAPGSKLFAVYFKEGFGNRFAELFSAGTVLPVHTIMERAGLQDFVYAISGEDPEQLQALGRAWQETFNVQLTDPATVPTSGPFRVTALGANGELKLESNPAWVGAAPGQSPIYIWPDGADIAALADEQAMLVVDHPTSHDAGSLGSSSQDWNLSNPASSRVDTIRIAGTGVLQEAPARLALNACVDRGRIVGSLKEATGIDVIPTGLRVVAPTNTMAARLIDINDGNSAVNMEFAASTLQGAVIRIGYLESTQRFATILESIRQSCGEAGVIIEPVPLNAENYNGLGVEFDALLDTRDTFGRNSSQNANGFSRLEAIRDAEIRLHEEAMTIPLVTEARAIAVHNTVNFVSDNGSDAGLSWNMDRWVTQSTTPTETTPPTSAPEGPAGDR